MPPRRAPPRPASRRGITATSTSSEHEQGWTRRWDDETKNPWLVSPDGSMVIGYDDAESVGLKTEWAMKRGFRGVFFWQVAADRLPDGTNPLQEASRKEWDGAARRSGQRRPPTAPPPP